jgi:transcriptional regulator with XRE-family HTH domain
MHLRALRRRRKLTQAELAKISKVAQNSISRLEIRADANPTLATVQALADALGVKPTTIEFGRSDEAPS